MCFTFLGNVFSVVEKYMYKNVHLEILYIYIHGLPWWLSGKEAACNAGDMHPIPGLGRFPGEECGNPLEYSCLENLVVRGACSQSS